MKFRLLPQPVMASIFAITSGLKDARTGKLPDFWALTNNPAHRADMLKDGWKSVGKVFILAMVLDVVSKVIELHTVYRVEALVVVSILAIVPYLLLRGLVGRLARHPKPRAACGTHAAGEGRAVPLGRRVTPPAMVRSQIERLHLPAGSCEGEMTCL